MDALFAVNVLDQIESWLINVVGTGLGAIAVLSITYVFLWFFSAKARKHEWDEINLPLGISFKRIKQDAAHAANADMMVLEGLMITGQKLEYRAREQMLEVMYRVVKKYLKAHACDKELVEYIHRGRLPLTIAVSNNHIIYSLAHVGIDNYIREKQLQVLDAVGMDVDDTQPAVHVLGKLVEEFVGQIIVVQKKLCVEKVKSYNSALDLFQLEGNIIRCQNKIKKNEGYIEAINHIEQTIDPQLTGIIAFRQARPPQDELHEGGETIMFQQMQQLENLKEGLTASGIYVKENKEQLKKSGRPRKQAAIDPYP